MRSTTASASETCTVSPTSLGSSSPDKITQFIRRHAGLEETAITRQRPTSVEAGLSELFGD